MHECMPRNDSMRKDGRTWNCRVALDSIIDQDAGSLNHKEPQNDPNLPALSPLLLVAFGAREVFKFGKS